VGMCGIDWCVVGDWSWSWRSGGHMARKRKVMTGGRKVMTWARVLADLDAHADRLDEQEQALDAFRSSVDVGGKRICELVSSNYGALVALLGDLTRRVEKLEQLVKAEYREVRSVTVDGAPAYVKVERENGRANEAPTHMSVQSCNLRG